MLCTARNTSEFQARMGGVVSAGRDNEELVDNLCKERCIVSPKVEKVFRMIDRKDYMVFEGEDANPLEAYEDRAWRYGNMHLSAPCIYTRAMECLYLENGLSLLTIGSGTGYFSTMAGLLLGYNGINHGIEIYRDNVEFAQEKLQNFKENSCWYDPVEFCEPQFTCGNGLLLCPQSGMLYDRIYCGAACPAGYVDLLKNMMKIGGIMILPCEEELETVSRITETEWVASSIMSGVAFAPLILPSGSDETDMQALTIAMDVPRLQEIARHSILECLGRHRYQHIPSLPLPRHLVDYTSYSRTWEHHVTTPTLLCPIEQVSSDDESSTDTPSVILSSQHGERTMFFSVNGVLFEVPINDNIDHDDSDHSNGRDDSDHSNGRDDSDYSNSRDNSDRSNGRDDI